MSYTEIIDDVKNIKIIGIGAEGEAFASKVLSIEPHLCVLFLQDQIPSVSQCSGDEKDEALKKIFTDTHLLFIASDITDKANFYKVQQVVHKAREQGVLVLGVALTCVPEVTEKMLLAWYATVDALLVVDPGKLHKDLHSAAHGVAAIVSGYGHVNVDLEDIRDVLSTRGVVRVGSSTAAGPDRAERAALAAIQDIDLTQAKGMLLLLSSTKGSLRMSEARQVMRIVMTHLPESAHIVYGAAYDELLGDQLRVTMLISGLNHLGRVAEKWLRFFEQVAKRDLSVKMA